MKKQKLENLHVLAESIKASLNEDLYKKGSLCYTCINYKQCTRVKDHRHCHNFKENL